MPIVYSFGELLDRYAIEYRKSLYGGSSEEYLTRLRQAIHDQIGSGMYSLFAISGAELGVLNADIANCEWQIRVGQDLPLEEIGRRAKLTRWLNDKRSAVKARFDKDESRLWGYGDKLEGGITLDVQEPGGVR